MNIIEAIKSGKRFKRSSEIAWMSDDQLYNYVKADIIADDWEIEQTMVTITREQFEEIWNSVMAYIDSKGPYFRPDLARAMICEKLGL